MGRKPPFGGLTLHTGGAQLGIGIQGGAQACCSQPPDPQPKILNGKASKSKTQLNGLKHPLCSHIGGGQGGGPHEGGGHGGGQGGGPHEGGGHGGGHIWGGHAGAQPAIGLGPAIAGPAQGIPGPRTCTFMGAHPGSGPQYEATDTVDPTVNRIRAIPTQMEVILTTIPLLLSEKANKIHGFCSFTKRFYHL